MDLPNARERTALRNGCHGGPGGENAAQLCVGKKTIAGCVEKGWLQRMPDGLNGSEKYQTTEVGTIALNAPVRPVVRSKPRIKMLRSPIATLDTRTAKSLPRKR